MSARKIFYMFVMLIVSQTVAAESLNYFQNSTEWVSEGRGTQWEPCCTKCVHGLEKRS